MKTFGLSLLSTAIVASVSLAGPAWACEPCGCEKQQVGHANAPQQDRRAILAMTGDYRVTFQFQETVGIEPGYEFHDPYYSEATEFVEVIEDTGDFISLQHILVLKDKETGEDRVVKHWRQDWKYQDTRLNEFRGNKTWELVTLEPEEVAGKWSQAVYQVDDSPRYEAVGRWTHTGNRSVWESDDTWRPLPRREFSKRSDYQVLVAKNRHTITPEGWVHEQDNYKLVLDDEGQPEKVLAHESGLNVYDRVDDVDFTAGHQYWDQTQAYWQDVREIWADVLGQPGSVTLEAKVDDKRLHQVMFDLADQVREGEVYDSATMQPVIRERITSFVK